jgi:hypothetical protein
MQDFDSFILPIPGFEGDIPIPTILISARDPGAESSEHPSIRPSASASRMRAYKRKMPIDLSPSKKAKKITGKPSCRIKITGTKKAPASTPLLGIRKGIPILRSKRYTYFKYSLPLYVVNPQTSMQSAPRYSFDLSYKEHFTQEQVPKGGQAPESFCWKNPSGDAESRGLRGHQCFNWCRK